MGQEASLPQADGDGLEDQARAPPSSVNPPMHGQANARPGTKMIGTMLHRAAAGRAHNNKDFEGKEAARAAAAAGQMPYMAPTTHYGNGGAAAGHAQSQPYPNNLQHMTPEEQQYYLHQQQQQQQQQQSMNGIHHHHQQQPQIHHNQYPDQHQHNSGVHGAPQHLHAQQGSTANVNLAVGSPGFYGTAKGGRGKKLINSMRNLSISSTIRSGVQATANAAVATASATASAVSATAAAVNANVVKASSSKGGASEWETRWDEDDDDSDGEDENDTNPNATVSPIHHHQTQQQSPVRPGIDDGHSSLSPGAAGLSTLPQTPQTQKRPNVVTPVKNDPAIIPDDGLEWDTGTQQDVVTKPNVQMFLPLLRVLGKGSFGKVVLVQKRVGKEHGSLFAMKILRKTHLVKRRQIERTRTERKVLSAVNHPFIMKLHYAFQTPEKLYLVLDYCPGGHVKLGDFGLAKAGLKHPCEGATSMCGTPEYMAPEVLGQQGHGFCVDYWGLGMLLYEMMTGLPPWYTTDRAKLFRRLKSAPLDIPNKFSSQAASCVSALLERNPRRRLGVAGVRTAMEHEFFRTINWRALYGRRVEAPIRPCEGWKPPDGNDASVDGMIHTNVSASATSSNEIDQFSIDAATANFDNTFTRMPVHSEEAGNADDSEAAEQLAHDTFVGFTFDDRDREAQASGRPRTQMYQQTAQTPPQQPRTLD
ncbi:RAC family serine/threonine-protein kinase homolog [Seminavis robusta]|uniref:RAC family serine/threonine-protein kinase homolog n=1 Tax=Seminavis robusta TaxID=568900 RepID=A0A9N8ELP5_9STRA|nr:RAC family serine/threonine-protein kinase homolog [Seminavis robusta]|eukprot:Sro1137_g245310.1 RAC family serine/threonine-protein kinase homolog (702) ;mRNA; r:19414-21758